MRTIANMEEELQIVRASILEMVQEKRRVDSQYELLTHGAVKECRDSPKTPKSMELLRQLERRKSELVGAQEREMGEMKAEISMQMTLKAFYEETLKDVTRNIRHLQEKETQRLASIDLRVFYQKERHKSQKKLEEIKRMLEKKKAARKGVVVEQVLQYIEDRKDAIKEKAHAQITQVKELGLAIPKGADLKQIIAQSTFKDKKYLSKVQLRAPFEGHSLQSQQILAALQEIVKIGDIFPEKKKEESSQMKAIKKERKRVRRLLSQKQQIIKTRRCQLQKLEVSLEMMMKDN